MPTKKTLFYSIFFFNFLKSNYGAETIKVLGKHYERGDVQAIGSLVNDAISKNVYDEIVEILHNNQCNKRQSAVKSPDTVLSSLQSDFEFINGNW